MGENLIFQPKNAFKMPSSILIVLATVNSNSLAVIMGNKYIFFCKEFSEFLGEIIALRK